MATVKAFRALRPEPAKASEFASLPYDVMDVEEAQAMVQKKPQSFLRVTRAEVDLPANTDVHAPEVYRQARARLEQCLAEGLVRQDETPSLYVYRQWMGSSVQTGIAALCSVDEYRSGVIRKHELTRPDKEQDRVDHIHATSAQTGPVFCVYRKSPAISAVVSEVVMQKPEVDFTAEDGIRHALWVISDEKRIKVLEAAFKSNVDRIYIADGHHRAAAASRVSDLRPNSDAQWFLTVLFPHDDSHILDYNRVVTDWGAKSPQGFLEEVKGKFVVEKCADAGTETGKPDIAHTFGVYMEGDWYKLTPKEGSFDPSDRLGRLDVNILQKNLLTPILGIGDPRTDKRIQFVGGIRGMGELRRLVDSGRAVVAFSLFPTSIEDLMAVADANEIMPPKSTWFEPKLRDGMVVHLIGD